MSTTAKSKLNNLLRAAHSSRMSPTQGRLDEGLISADEATILAIIAEKRRMPELYYKQLTRALQTPVMKKVAAVLWVGPDGTRRSRATREVKVAARQIEELVEQNRNRIRHAKDR